MKKVLSFDIDQTLNIAKTPIPDEIAVLLTDCLNHFEICPISGQKFDQFLIQIVDRLVETGKATEEQLSHLHLFVAQGTQYYRYVPSGKGSTKSSKIVFLKLLSLHSAKKLALKLNMLGIQIVRNANKSLNFVKKKLQSSNMKSVVLLQLTLSPQA